MESGNFVERHSFLIVSGEYSNDIQYVYKNIGEYNTSSKCNVLTVFDDMIADMISN